jgi:transposase
MGVAVPLRVDFDGARLRLIAKKSKDGPQARRLLALAAVYDGASRSEAAKIGGVTVQIVRDWVVKFNTEGPDRLIDREAPGQPSLLKDTHLAALAGMIESGPVPAAHGVVRWRLVDLCQWVWEEFRISIAKQTMSRELRAMGYRKLSARPRHHAQRPGAIEDFKKLPRPPGGGCKAKGRRCKRHRDMVRRRGPHRPEEQDHKALGQARHQAFSAPRPAHRLDLHLRRHLPERRKRCCRGATPRP